MTTFLHLLTVVQDVPILGICYGMQELAYRLSKDNVVAGTARE
jgi:GMP synthase-like glutamine amidotransferase